MRRDAYPTVYTQGRGRADLSHCIHFESPHPTVAILQMRRAAYPTVDTRGRKVRPVPLCTLLSLTISLWSFYKGKELHIPQLTH